LFHNAPDLVFIVPTLKDFRLLDLLPNTSKESKKHPQQQPSKEKPCLTSIELPKTNA